MAAKSKKREYTIERNFEPVGAYLKEKRIASGLQQLDVSEAMGYSSPQFVSNFECGISLPPLKKMRTLVHLYRMDVDELFDLILAVEKENMLRDFYRKSK